MLRRRLVALGASARYTPHPTITHFVPILALLTYVDFCVETLSPGFGHM